MYTHHDIWQAVDKLAGNFGFSPSGLARKAGLDPTAFNKSKRTSADGKPRWPSTESIAKILAVTGTTMTDFFALADGTARPSGSSAARAQTLPLLGLAQAGRDGYFDEDGCPTGTGWDQIDFPSAGEKTKSRDLYALEISGNSMEPLYRAGDVVVVSPHELLRRGDRVIVRTKKGELMAKELVRQGAEKIELKSLNADHGSVALEATDVLWMARIVWVSQ